MNAAVAVVVLPSATETDALSTALLTLGPEGHDGIFNLRPGMRTLVACESGGALSVDTRNLAIHASTVGSRKSIGDDVRRL
jgi:thiamine biosynthesis lipoprotein ApbE